MRSAFSRKPPNVESSDCTNAEASESIWEPSTVDNARIQFSQRRDRGGESDRVSLDALAREVVMFPGLPAARDQHTRQSVAGCTQPALAFRLCNPRAQGQRGNPAPFYFLAYSSTGLSFGFAQAALVASLAGRPTLVLLGGIGCTNHLS